MLSFVAVATVAGAAGCNTVPADKFQAVQRDLQLSQERVRKLEAQLAEEQAAIRAAQDQIIRLQAGKADPGDLIVPEKIQLEKMSGGYSPEGATGDVGIILYIQPLDKDGSVIKAAGSIDVKLFDLANPQEKMLLGTYHFDVPTTRSMWYGRLLTNHFTVKCPFPPNKPLTHNEITAQVVFTDLLTGRALQAQGVYRITFAPQPSTSPGS